MALPQQIIDELEVIKEKELLNKFYEFVKQNNIPFYVENFNSPNAVALRSGVYVSNLFLNKYDGYRLLFAMVHESAHYIRYGDIDYDLVSLTDLPFDDFFKAVEKEEDYADDLAYTIILNWIQEFKLEKKLKKYLDLFEKKKQEPISEKNYIDFYEIINNHKKNYQDTEQLIFDLMNNKLHENILRKRISKIVKELFESPEVAPAEPVTKPKPKEQPGPKPRRILKPQIHPGADPAPKAKNKDSFKKKVELTEEKIQESLIDMAHKLYLLKEAPLQYSDDEMGSPNPEIKKNIEQRGSNPFSKIDILHKDAGNNQKSIEKLSDEEYKDVIDTAKKHGINKPNVNQQMELFKKAMEVQEAYKENLEQLAKDVVKRYFGIPDEVMENISVKLTNDQNDVQLDKPKNVNMPQNDNDNEEDEEGNEEEKQNDDLDNNKGFQELVDDFTPEEKEIIKQNVDKRTIANALMMGAGFRAHNLMEKIKPALDALNPILYPFYSKIMSQGALQTWKVKPQDDGGFEMDAKEFGVDMPGMPKNFKMSSDMLKKMGVVGKSELILGDDKNGDGIREVEGARAVAMVFPVLLHETVKACIEYIFANGLPQYTEKINREIISQSDKFQYEYWHKLLGPRLWKYLHDAIDYIVKERGNDYTIVAYLLQEISMLPPDKFLRFIDLILHEGNKAIVWLEKMLDRIEDDLANQDDEGMEDVPRADFNNIQNLMGQINNLLQQPGAEPKPEPEQHKPFNQMNVMELKDFIIKSLDAGDFEKAAEARDELEKREQQ